MRSPSSQKSSSGCHSVSCGRVLKVRRIMPGGLYAQRASVAPGPVQRRKGMQVRNVGLVDGAPSAFARGAKGKLVATRLDDAGASVLRALLDRNRKVKDAMIEDIGVGNVAGHGEWNYLGTIQRLAGLPLEVCAFNSNRQ